MASLAKELINVSLQASFNIHIRDIGCPIPGSVTVESLWFIGAGKARGERGFCMQQKFFLMASVYLNVFFIIY